MASTAAAFSCLVSILLVSSAAAFNVTDILGQYPDLGAFNALLSETGLASEINARQTITVLAVGSDALDAVSGRPVDVVKRILSLHVVLDYYDANKLKKIKSSAILTTLYQTTGTAGGKSGFLNVTVSDGGATVEFGSAAAGEPLGSTLVKEVETKPYNISILQVSDVIEPRGIDNASTPSLSPPTASPSPKGAPSPSKSSSPDSSPSPSSDTIAPTPSSDAANAHSTDSSPTPTADSPADSKADAPSADRPSSSAGRAVVASTTIVVAAAAAAAMAAVLF